MAAVCIGIGKYCPRTDAAVCDSQTHKNTPSEATTVALSPGTRSSQVVKISTSRHFFNLRRVNAHITLDDGLHAYTARVAIGTRVLAIRPTTIL